MVSPLNTVIQGKLRGQYEVDIHGTPFLSFMGIPYAKPPTGDLRFKPPQPAENWDGLRSASKQGNPCHALHLLPTPGSLMLKQTGSEDCLFLNVYTRGLGGRHDLKPVMMFIHGGAFVAGSSDRSMYGPEFLMTEDIVLVTINYRLGALGFLTMDDPSFGVTGNVGLKDQVQALKWIQGNINNFGGDPDNVTIFGESAGAASVHYLVLSPLAKGLFHKAIIQSASVLCPWTRGTNDAKILAHICGCTETDPLKILQFFQKIPIEKLVEGQIMLGDVFVRFQKESKLLFAFLESSEKTPFRTIIEPESKNTFLSEEPMELINSGNYNQVPLMFGYTSMEGIFEEGTKLLGFQSNFEEFVPYYYYFGYPVGSEDFKNINEKIPEFYFKTKTPDSNNKEALYTVLTDAMFLRSIHLAVKAHAKSSQKPVYIITRCRSILILICLKIC